LARVVFIWVVEWCGDALPTRRFLNSSWRCNFEPSNFLVWAALMPVRARRVTRVQTNGLLATVTASMKTIFSLIQHHHYKEKS
jgi:hypothetical protein